jgi:hypothetical protein
VPRREGTVGTCATTIEASELKDPLYTPSTSHMDHQEVVPVAENHEPPATRASRNWAWLELIGIAGAIGYVALVPAKYLFNAPGVFLLVMLVMGGRSVRQVYGKRWGALFGLCSSAWLWVYWVRCFELLETFEFGRIPWTVVGLLAIGTTIFWGYVLIKELRSHGPDLGRG